ncbi:SH3 domain-containing protein [Streptomyces sparsogenes]|uniref:SH3 domain-containing protein n=1 Tax=Streptomyces sparsogenes TaxID=67365 RepID=UPI0033CA9893
MQAKYRASAIALTASLLLGGSMALAPTASAVGSSACRFNSPDVNFKVRTSGATFRTGPGKRYHVIGTLYRGDSFRYYCRTGGLKDFRKSWSYGKLLKRSRSGIPAGTKGWVYSKYLD